MLKLGIIGTSWISHEFITAAHQTGHYHLQAVYSRKMKTAQEFCEPYGAISCYTDFIDFLDSELDVVYIASPNSLHFDQAKLAILAKKHVIIEKPAVTTPSEWKELVKLANEHQVYLFEAARNYQEAAFQVIKDFLSNQEILGANFTFAKYSSKLPALLAGEIPNIFSDVYAGGALMDLGVYCLYLAIGFFGDPISSHYTAQQLPNSVDLYGQGVLIYPDFQVAIQAGKNITSHLPAEIYTKTGTLTLNAVTAINQARFVSILGRLSTFRSSPAHTKCKKRRKPLPLPSLIKSQLLILNGYKQVSRSMKPSTRCVRALEYNLRMKKNERTISTKLERSARNTRI